MFDVILATTKSGGIGLNGRMAWRCSDELKLFRGKTDGSILIVGRKTAQGLPKLENRTILCISKNENLRTSSYKNRVTSFTSFEDALNYASRSRKKIFVAGGAQLYKLVFTDHIHQIDQVHLSVMKKDYLTDVSVQFDQSSFLIEDKYVADDFTHYVFTPGVTSETQYLNLLKDVKNNGVLRDGRNGETLAKFTEHLKFDLREGFPLLTTKKMFWKGIIEELLFFLRGDTDSTTLEEKGIKIWSGNTDRKFLDSHGFNNRDTGVMGPMYGYQWRHFGANYDEKEAGPTEPGVDQLKEVINQIRDFPHSRRHLMVDYNPAQAKEGVLYPCHSLVLQFFVDREYLDVFCYNRSSDLFLGLPFNIASSSLLLNIIAEATELTPLYLNLTLGDAHIYKEHFDAVDKQIDRTCYALPTLKISKDLFDLNDIETLTIEDFDLQNYNCHPGIKAKMIA
jgi:thymidylate synthase